MPAERSPKRTAIPPGEPIASYRCRPLRWGEALILLLFLATAVGGPLLYGYYRAQYAYAYYGPVAAITWSRPWFLLAALALVISLTLLIYRVIESRRQVKVYANGLLLTLSRKQFFPWGSLSGVASGAIQARFLSIRLGTQYQATLYPAVGKPVSLESTLDQVTELLTQIKARLYPHLLPNLMQAFTEGKRVYFGKIGIDQTSLQIKNGNQTNNTLGWKQINRLRVDSGLLIIEPENGNPIRIPILEIPNLELLLQIVQTGVNP